MEVKVLTSESTTVSSAVSGLEYKIREYIAKGYIPQGSISTTYEHRRMVSNEATASIVMIKH